MTPNHQTRSRRPRCRRWTSILLPTAWAVLVVLSAPPVAAQDPDADPDLTQTIDEDQAVLTGPADLDRGHVDLGPRFVNGTWTLMVHDDTHEPSVWRPLDDVVIQIHDQARLPVPDDRRYDFLGLPPGSPVHVIPQTQNPDVVWLGWNTQAPDVLANVDRGVTMRLLGVDGPGELTVYLQAGVMEPPDVLWRSTDSEPQPLFVDVNTHTHANWLFTAPGVYLAYVQITADLITGDTVTETTTLRFAVGDTTDPEQARATTANPPAAPAPGGAAAPPAPSPVVSNQGSSAPWIIGIVALAGVLTGGVGITIARGNSARRRAATDRAIRDTATEMGP